jgi:hypothetical protein
MSDQPANALPPQWYEAQRAAVAWGIAHGLVTRPTADDPDPAENAPTGPTARRDPFAHLRKTHPR